MPPHFIPEEHTCDLLGKSWRTAPVLTHGVTAEGVPGSVHAGTSVGTVVVLLSIYKEESKVKFSSR